MIQNTIAYLRIEYADKAPVVSRHRRVDNRREILLNTIAIKYLIKMKRKIFAFFRAEPADRASVDSAERRVDSRCRALVNIIGISRIRIKAREVANIIASLYKESFDNWHRTVLNIIVMRYKIRIEQSTILCLRAESAYRASVVSSQSRFESRRKPLLNIICIRYIARMVANIIAFFLVRVLLIEHLSSPRNDAFIVGAELC